MVFWLIGAAIVFVIAAVAVGRVTANLVRSPERAIYDAHQSIEFVAEALPHELTAVLSYEDLRQVLHLFHDYLHAEGVATTAGGHEADEPDAVVDLDAAADYVVWRAAQAKLTIEPAHARAVIDAQMAYLEAIGALGEPVDPGDVPGDLPGDRG